MALHVIRGRGIASRDESEPRSPETGRCYRGLFVSDSVEIRVPHPFAISLSTLALNISVHYRTYNTYGGHSTLSLVGRYFSSGLPPLGLALKEIEIIACFRSGTGPKKTLESIHANFERFITTLPLITFHRQKARFTLTFLSELGNSTTVAGYGPPRLDLFNASAREIADRLTLLRSKLKASDDFRADVLDAEIRKKLGALPLTDQALQALKTRLDEEERREHEAMDEWEKLGIDWEDYHPQCRQILDDPFFWSGIDDFAPHGNDTGADVLGLYDDWRKQSPHVSAVRFLERLVRGWGFTQSPSPDDEIAVSALEEAKIALAFAQIKIEGVCEDPVRQLALAAIASCRQRTKERHYEWAMSHERLRTLDHMEGKLREAAVRGIKAALDGKQAE